MTSGLRYAAVLAAIAEMQEIAEFAKEDAAAYEIWMGISFERRPPCGFRWLRRTCL